MIHRHSLSAQLLRSRSTFLCRRGVRLYDRTDLVDTCCDLRYRCRFILSILRNRSNDRVDLCSALRYRLQSLCCLIGDLTTVLDSLELSPLYERLQYAPAEEIDAILAEYAGALGRGEEARELTMGYLRVAAVIAARHIVADAGLDPQRALDEGLIAEALQPGGGEGFEAVRSLLAAAIDCRDRSGKGLGQTPVRRARVYLSQRYADPNLMLQDVAGEVGMSQSHFSTVFAQETGLTFTQYLTALRIGKAKELLSATAMRSSEIAFAVGYNDAHYFSYLFKKQTGLTPSEYRKSNKNEQESNENENL